MGNTGHVSKWIPITPVHPHACGEHGLAVPADATGHGSSPRMWGTQHTDEAKIILGRFIPTHVGNTPWLLQQPPQQPVHPHACGEHRLTARFVRSPIGSSPRMWGTRDQSEVRGWLHRFIPTHVGNTYCYGFQKFPPPVHPHACGEHYTDIRAEHRDGGSSPRMWGTPGRRQAMVP